MFPRDLPSSIGAEVAPTRGMRLRRASRTALLMLVVSFAASCGGGVDSGGTGAPAVAFASGPITGFGSVIVNGVHFDDRTALVSDANGNPRTRDDLRLGMTTDVRGLAIAADSDGNSASVATSIVFGSELLGPIAASDLVARTLVVLGQTVDIAATTVFDTSLIGGQAALAIGDVVEVYAQLDAMSSHYVATRIERKSGVNAFVLRGIVAGLDATARTFAIGAARISYAGIAAGNVPATLANDRFVRAFVNVVPSAGVWIAFRLADGTPSIDDRPEADVTGRVSAFTSSAAFSVNGTSVDARGATFPSGTTGLGLGTRVEVEGSIVAGVLVARTVAIVSDNEESGRDFDVRGAITSIDTVAKLFVVRDVAVSYAGTVDFRDGSAADLFVGNQVEARGKLSADGTTLIATRIDFRH